VIRRLWKPGTSRRNVLIAGLGVLVIGVGSGVGVYLNARTHAPLQQLSARQSKGAPTPAPVGAQAPVQPEQIVALSVVSTTPANLASAISASTSITLGFNLAVNPAGLGALLSVQSSDQDVAGVLSQGKTSKQVVFKPSSPFYDGTSVVVVLQSGLRSVDGAVLSNDYSFSFTTAAGPQSVSFFNDGQLARLVNVQSGKPVTLEIETGEGVPSTVAINTYRASAKDMLAGLVYTKTSDGFANYWDPAVPTKSLHLVANGAPLTASGARTTKLESGVVATINQPDGVYAVVAADAKRQYGSAWIVISHYGVLVRQDDQKIVAAGEDLTTGQTTPTFNINFYNLLNGVHPKLSGSFTGTGEFAAKYPAGIDIAVATSGGEEVAVPIAAPESGADLRVSTDLARQPQIFLTTDRPSYQKGDTVRFAGVARSSNDQAYSLAAGSKVTVWTLRGTVVENVSADGTFSGSFKLADSDFATDGGDTVQSILASSSEASFSDPNAIVSSASFVAVAPNSATNVLTVSLDKASYYSGDTIVASIAAVNANKQPLAGQTVRVGLYATQRPWQPAEMDDYPAPADWGARIGAFVTVRLDASGRATFRTTPKFGTDQNITVVAVYGSGKTQAFAAKTAVLYQADDEVYLLPARWSFQQGDTVVAPFVVESRTGGRIGGISLAYELVGTDYSGDKAITTVVASGTTTTNGNGLGVVKATYKGEPAQLTLRVKGKDQAGRAFQNAADITVGFYAQSYPLLDVITDKIVYSVGDTATLTLTSPATFKALLSLERGRVHHYEWVQLAKGSNSIGLTISPDLAPGFSAEFSYFQNGEYHTEGLPIFINNSSRLLKVTVTPDQQSYAKGQVAHLSITVADATGAPVAATLLAHGYEARISANLTEDQPSIASAFLTPNRVGTNGSSSLVSVGMWGDGRCGGGDWGPPDLYTSGMYPGRSNVWLTNITTDSSGHASIDVPMSLAGAVKVVVVASTPSSSWGQAETVLPL